MILKLILIPMLVKVLLTTRKPHYSALLYGGAIFTNSLLFDLAFTGDTVGVLIELLGATGLSYAFFWALNEFESGPLYWVVLVLGVPALILFF
jgi:hypothetical protein